MLPFPFPGPTFSSCDALLKMPLAVDHQGDQEASVGAALHRVYTPPIHRIYNDASAQVGLVHYKHRRLNVNAVVSHLM